MVVSLVNVSIEIINRQTYIYVLFCDFNHELTMANIMLKYSTMAL